MTKLVGKELENAIEELASQSHQKWATGQPYLPKEYCFNNKLTRLGLDQLKHPRLKDISDSTITQYLFDNIKSKLQNKSIVPICVLPKNDERNNAVKLENNRTYDFSQELVYYITDGEYKDLYFSCIPIRGAFAIDIANTPYQRLSNKWKGENRFAAEFAISLMNGVTTGEFEKNPDYYGKKIHESWAKRNPWEKLAQVAWEDLPKHDKPDEIKQQEKDLIFARLALKIVTKISEKQTNNLS